MTRLRGVGARLSLALALVVALALGIVYLIVVPSLESRLIASKQAELRAILPQVARELPDDAFAWADFVDVQSFQHSARVVVFAVDSVAPTDLRVVADSRGATSRDVADDPLARQAAEQGKVVSGGVTRGGGRFAEVAVPVDRGRSVLLLQRSVADSVANIRLVERRLVAAGLIALVVAAALGLGGAAVFARRIRRLERAVQGIAQGRFDQPVGDQGRDELGQLAQAVDHMRERLQGLDGARREFIANASHELRTPLFALSGALELLDDEEMDDVTRAEFVGSMREQTARLTRLADDLLDLSRLDAGKLRVERERVGLADVAAELLAEFGPAAALSGHHVQAESCDGAALADDERVLQIGRGLVGNALRHTPAGSTVRLFCEPAGLPDRIRFVVADDGPGVPAGDLERIFQRFYRVEGGSGASAHGSGLGLAIGREVAQLMGGDLTYERRAAESWFVITLPRWDDVST